MEALIDENMKAILINNPSNPCGSNYTVSHLNDIVSIARKHNLPILADEIYGGVVFHGEFCPLHAVCGDVPVLSLGGSVWFLCVCCAYVDSRLYHKNNVYININTVSTC